MSATLVSVQQDFDEFIQSCHTLQMASLDNASEWPEASYAPFIQRGDCWYVYVSELAQHTSNLLSHTKASVMLIEPEGAAGHLFARKRMSMRVHVSEVSRGTSEFDYLLDLFGEKFGELIAMLRGLTDFHLLALRPESGVFVRGFAQAFVLTGEGMRVVSHIRDKGHRSTKPEPVKEIG